MPHNLSRFEALGFTQDLLIAQRRRGVEPRGLFGFARGDGIGAITRLIETDFAGVGEAGRTVPGLSLGPAAAGATPEAANDGPALAALLQAQLRVAARAAAGVAWLRARLAGPATVFVLTDASLPALAEAEALRDALRARGPHALLLVEPGAADVCEPAELAPHVFHARLRSLACSGDARPAVRVDAWEALCRRVWLRLAPPGGAPAGMPEPPLPTPAPTAPAQSALAEALALHRAGRLAEAEAGYRAVLADTPTQADALHLLALCREALGAPEEALALIERAVALSPSPRYRASLGLLLGRLDRHMDAVAALRLAVSARPDYPEAWNNLGVSLLALDRADEAVAAHRRALALRPAFAEALVNLGHALALSRDIDGAAAAYRDGFALQPALAPSRDPADPGAARRAVLFVAADAAMPGAVYRCARMAEATAATGRPARWRALHELRPDDLRGLAALVLWRIEATGPACRAIALARAAGIAVGVDLDDLILDPALAQATRIDAIRSLGLDERIVAAQFDRVRQTVAAADFAVASTEEIADAMAAITGLAWTVPNGFDAATHRAARTARRRRAMAADDGLVRIGYAAGTRTHQRDLAPLAATLAEVLAERKQARLVLFRTVAGRGFVDLDEWPALAACAQQIEWRTQVALTELPAALAEFDLAIAPVELGNRFAEAKSEGKFHEAALAGVPLIASPTGPFRRAIVHGRTGLLAATPADWGEALRALLDDPARRVSLGLAARAAALWRFGPQRRARTLADLFDELEGGAAAATAFAHAALPDLTDPPDIAAARVLFRRETGADSPVSLALALDAATVDAALAAAAGCRDCDLIAVAADAAVAAHAARWLEAAAGQYRRSLLLLPAGQPGPAGALDLAMAWCDTEWCATAPGAVRLAAAGTEALGYLVPASDVGSGVPGTPRRWLATASETALLAPWAWSAGGGFAGNDAGPVAALLRRLAALGIPGGSG